MYKQKNNNNTTGHEHSTENTPQEILNSKVFPVGRIVSVSMFNSRRAATCTRIAKSWSSGSGETLRFKATFQLVVNESTDIS